MKKTKDETLPVPIKAKPFSMKTYIKELEKELKNGADKELTNTLTVNKKLSGKYHKQFKCKPGRCYANCFKALQQLPDSIYVEGKYGIVNSDFITDHAWLEINGEIIELTRPKDDHVYYPIFKYSNEECKQIFIKKNNDFSLPLFYNNMKEHGKKGLMIEILHFDNNHK